MDLAYILNKYAGHSSVVEACELADKNNFRSLRWTGLMASAPVFFTQAVFERAQRPLLFVCNEKEQALYFQSDLTALLGSDKVLFFPDSFKRPGKLDEIDNHNVQLRTEAVTRLVRFNKPCIIVSYPEALSEKVVRPTELQRSLIHIVKDKKANLDQLMRQLADAQFERVEFVYEPGQFSIRGGIIDVFSFGFDFPYRIELFGDTVESIRVFDPENQLSKRNLSEVSIVPNIQTRFATGEKDSVFKILDKRTLLWMEDPPYLGEVVSRNFLKASEIFSLLKPDQIPEEHKRFFLDQPEENFLRPEILAEEISGFGLFHQGSKPLLPDEPEVFARISPQPVFRKNFNLLIDDLIKKEKTGYENFLFVENPKQQKRFHHIFADLGAKVSYAPINLEIHEGFIDHDLHLACYTDHQVFDRFHKYKVKQGFNKSQALLMKTLRELKPGDFVTHIDHGVGVYSGLEKIEVNGRVQESVRILYKDNDLLYVGINSLHKISKYSGKDGTAPKLNKLGSDAWEQVKRKTKKKIKDIARELIQLYAKRKAAKGFAFSPDSYLQTELEASFIYEDTPDQVKATRDFKKDMEQPHPMDRLVCGDVGFGKTEIAVRAAFKAVADSKQVAVLVPTTILALQHYKTFSSRLDEFPATIDYINRFRSSKEKKETLQKVKEGKVDILIGTHAILSKNVEFRNLGLLIIDEEQKFGVAAKERLKEMRVNIDTLTLTATPIPRTLQFSMMGARDLSVINTPPPNRQPIQTELHTFKEELVRDAIYFETNRGGQVFFVHNRVKDIHEVAGMVRRLCPDLDIGVAHGQMPGDELEEVMLKFINRNYDVLLSTNIVESGLDIPNANTIIINNAHGFGLSDLHQLRGRVGRSNKKAFCYLFAPPLSVLPDDSKKRLRTIEQYSELGSGFSIALRDLDIRGAGNILGGEQSGFIAEIGMEMYQKILDEAVLELKETEFQDVYKEQLTKEQNYVRDAQIDSDAELLIPDHYVTSINERLSLYTELNNSKTEQDLATFRTTLQDRFGPVPPQVDELFDAIRLQWQARKLGFERIVLRTNQMRCFFVSNAESLYFQSETFTAILEFIQHQPLLVKLKQGEKYLILTFADVPSMKKGKQLLALLSDFCEKKVANSDQKNHDQ